MTGNKPAVVNNAVFILIIITCGLLIRLLALYIPATHTTDFACFSGWADKLYKNGFSDFYVSDGFTDYPPGYMYILYVVGFINSVFNFSYGSAMHVLLVKSPSILADLGAGVFIYYIARKRLSLNKSVVVALLYICNPAVILISSVWGQVDAIHTLVILVSVYLLTEKKMLPAFMLFVAGFTIKPQALMFAPVYLFFLWDYLRDNRFSGQAFLEIAKNGAICVFFLVFLMLPFAYHSYGIDFKPVIKQYADTIGSYPYASICAYNIWSLFGQNWKQLEGSAFLNIPFFAWGMAGIVFAVLACFYSLFKSKSKSNYFFSAALINICTFMLSVKMHERYAFTAMALFLASFALSCGEETKQTEEVEEADKKKSYRHIKILIAYIGFSIAFLINYIDVLRVSIQNYNWQLLEKTAIYFSWFSVIPFIYILFLGGTTERNEKNTSKV